MRIVAAVALVPWLTGLARASTGWRAAGHGLLLAATMGVLCAHWIAYAASAFFGLPWPLAVLFLLVYAVALAQPHLVLFAPLVRWAAQRTPRSAEWSLALCALLTLGYAGLEGLVPGLFGAGIGYALHADPVLRQLADLGGVSLLGAMVVAVNLLVWRIWEAWRNPETRRTTAMSHSLVLTLIVAAAVGYGVSRNVALATTDDGDLGALAVGVVQGNVDNRVRLDWAQGDDRAAEKQLSAYTLPTQELVERNADIDLLVWPEATFPGVFLQPGSAAQRGRANKFDRLVLQLGKPLLFGAYDMTGEGDDRTLYNAFFAIVPRYDKPGTPGTVQKYHKTKLLAFAETVPVLNEAPWLKAALPSLGFFTPGTGPGGFAVDLPNGETIRIGPILCSESLSADYVAETVRQGAELLVNIGSDGWFGSWGEPQFHLAAARMRSVEVRRPQIRAANTGISALILPNGEIRQRTRYGEKAAVVFDTLTQVPDSATLMVRWGNWFPSASGALAVLFVILFLVRHPRRQSAEQD